MQLLLFILGTIILELVKAKCEPVLSKIKYLDRSEGEFPRIISDSKLCDDQYPVGDLEDCDDSLLDIRLASHPVLPDAKNIDVHILLNISVLIHANISQTFIKFECLRALNYEDDYCHNHDSQIQKWGKMIWPCRSAKLRGNVEVAASIQTPITFNFDCFPIFGMSTYKLTALILPQRCKIEATLTTPMLHQLDPTVAAFYKTGKSHDWSPLIYVITSPADGIWILFEGNKYTPAHQIMFFIYKINDSNKMEPIHSRIVKSSNRTNGFKYQNIPKANYSVYGFDKRMDCEVHCNDENNCITCPHTILKFQLTADKFTETEILARKGARSLSFFLKGLIGAACGVIFYLVGNIVRVRICGHIRLFRRATTGTVEMVPLVRMKEVVILYSADCSQHKDAVIAFGEFLEEHGKCKVFLDEWELYKSDAPTPLLWFENMSPDVFKLFVLSNNSKKMLGITKSEGLPFHLFRSCIETALFEQSRLGFEEWSKKYMVCYFAYSCKDTFPSTVLSAARKVYEIPGETSKILGEIHKNEGNFTFDEKMISSKCEKINAKIKNYIDASQKDVHLLEEM
uniref:SEFIR domain-containing protein n=1 Tax=Rhabditophanes sp. KR3021 TaxID=114890 RepID=A0AC35TXF8_9BILA